MELVFEGGNGAEVAAAAPDGPEQVLVLLRASPQQPSVGGRHVGGYQVVAGESVTAVEPAQSAAEGESRDPGRRHDAERRCQSERLRGAVELAQREPGLGPTVLVSGSTRTAFIPDRSSMIAPSRTACPATL